MLRLAIVLALAFLICANSKPSTSGVLTVTIPLGIGTAEDEGEIISGIYANRTDATTYVLTPEATGMNDLLITATVVEKSSEFIVQFAASSSDTILSQSAGCGFDPPSGNATCTENLVEVRGTQTTSTVFTISGFLVHANVIASSGSIETMTPAESATPTTSSDPSSAPGPTNSSSGVNATSQPNGGGRIVGSISSILLPLAVLVMIA